MASMVCGTVTEILSDLAAAGSLAPPVAAFPLFVSATDLLGFSVESAKSPISFLSANVIIISADPNSSWVA